MTKRSKNFSAENDVSGETFSDHLRTACEGWFYMSETDAEVEPFFAGKAGEITKETLLEVTESPQTAEIEEGDIDVFFSRLWLSRGSGQEQTPIQNLRQFLEQNLTDLKVFRIGRIRIDVYVVGRDREGNLAGVKTVAVET